MDDETALDSLTALLDDSDMEEEEIKMLAEDDQKEECDMDEITAFLEESDDENELGNDSPVEATDGKCTSIPETNDLQNNDIEKDIEEESGSNYGGVNEGQQDSAEEVNNIQAELLEMKRKMQELQKRLALSQPQAFKQDNSISKKIGSSVDNKLVKKDTHSTNSTSLQGNSGPMKKKSCNSSLLNGNGKTYTKSPNFTKQKPSEERKIHESPKEGLKLLESEDNPFFPAKESKSPRVERKALEKDLFGDEDSDWDPMDEDEKIPLSQEGDELRKMITGNKKTKQSNATTEQVEELRKKAQRSQWKTKEIASSSHTSTVTKTAKENDAPSVTDPFSGIRIINPKISSMEMKNRMKDRKLIKISKIDKRVSEHDNWVTIGVIVKKTEPRQSTTGKTYCIWKLSDLQDCDITVSFFLFGDIYKQHWKNEVTAVVGILNPNLMDKAEKAQNDTALTVSHHAQIMLMGYSKDYGLCAAMTGKGNNMGKHCTNFINKQQGEFCTYHVQRAYSKKCAQRTELQGSYSGVTPKNHKYKPKDKKDSFFFYQGQTFTTGKMPGSKNNQNKVTVDNLKHKQAQVGKGKVTTMSIHSIDPKDMQLLQKLEKPNSEPNSLLDMLTVPTPGSMNFVKHLMTNDQKPNVATPTGKPAIQSVTPAELLKQHKLEIKQRRLGGIPPSDPLKSTPMLGKGFTPGKEICFDVSSPKLSLSKMKALAKIKADGGIKKYDPNAVKKKLSPKAQQNIKKRILEKGQEQEESSSSQEPPRKRSKLLGNIDQNSEEFKRLMKTTSKHKGILAEIETEVEEKYFMEQEKKERLEDKMASTMEMKVTVFTCKQCKYTAYKLKDECKQQNHLTDKVQATKRFFRCKKCKNRTTSIDKIPTHPCKNCGEDNYERVSMLQEQKGAKLPHETLCIRGDEIKFLGSMNEKVFL